MTHATSAASRPRTPPPLPQPRSAGGTASAGRQTKTPPPPLQQAQGHVSLSHATTKPYDQFIPALDPTGNHNGKIEIPFGETFDTKGRQEWLRTQGTMKKDLSLCILFQSDRCHLGTKCHQIHATREFVADSRAASVNIVNCCAECGDLPSREAEPVAALKRAFPSGKCVITGAPAGVDVSIPTIRLAWTSRLQQFLSNSSTNPAIAYNRVCRLHLSGKCKYGKDCKNIHICNRIATELSDPTPTTATVNRPNSRSSQLPAVKPMDPPALQSATVKEATEQSASDAPPTATKQLRSSPQEIAIAPPTERRVLRPHPLMAETAKLPPQSPVDCDPPVFATTTSPTLTFNTDWLQFRSTNASPNNTNTVFKLPSWHPAAACSPRDHPAMWSPVRP